jgi:multicomponent Na+:H+ antiporter subunit F
MSALFDVAALFLLVNVTAGLFRIARGPTAADRMLAAQLFGTTGVAILIVLAESQHTPALRDVALVFSLLAAVLAVAFVKRGAAGGADGGAGEQSGQ